MPEKESSNYEKLCAFWRNRILQMDFQQLQRKLPELKNEDGLLSLCHFGTRYGVSLTDGTIASLDDHFPVSTTVQLNIYNYLWFSKPEAQRTGRWVNFRDLRGASVFGPAFQKGILEPLAQSFSGNAQAFANACAANGGIRIPFGEVGYQLQAFAQIPLQFLFWDGDDEFAPRANILYDESAIDFTHVESTVSIAGEGAMRLVRAAGVPAAGGMFEMN